MSPDGLPANAELRLMLERAWNRRAELLAQLAAEETDAYRLFHGVNEGCPGLTIDRYGSLILIQTFREALSPDGLTHLRDQLRELLAGVSAPRPAPGSLATQGALASPFDFAYNHRGKTARESFDLWDLPEPGALAEREAREFGVRYLIRARHAGIDPWLFLDLRAGRRWLREAISASGRQDLTVLNLFSYTCSIAVSAARAGASETWNADFSGSHLEVGRRNAALNRIPPACFHTLEEDCLPVMRQLAGLPVGGRRGKTRKYLKVPAREFDFVVLDPPAWSKGAFGAVDVEHDYASLFKSAVLCAKPGGGRILATNHVPSVEREAWSENLQRCAAKAGRELRAIHFLSPEGDFPSPDGNPPLKIAVCEV